MSDSSEHPPRNSFRRLISGTASRVEARAAVRHLLSGCPCCTRLAEEERSATSSTSPSAVRNYDEIFERLERKVAAEVRKREGEKATAQHLYSELLEHEAVEALLQVQSTRRYASLALCELLLQKSSDLSREDAPRAQQAAELAEAVAEQLDLGLYGSPVVQDSQALTWAHVASAGQTEADLRAARHSFTLAEHLLGAGGERLAPAELLVLQASLASYAGRFEEAARLLNRAGSIYRQAGDRHRFGRTLIKKGAVLGNAGELDAATRLLRRGIDLIEATVEPRLMVCAVHNLIWFLHESGRDAQAAACVDGARRLYQRAGDRRDLGRLRWLEGKLAPRLDEAERRLREARDGLAREGLSYEAALASMDLAMRYATEQRGTEMRRHVDGMLPLFRSGDMYQETVVALLSFQHRGSDLGPQRFLDEMGAYIRRTVAEKNPTGLAPAVAAR